MIGPATMTLHQRAVLTMVFCGFSWSIAGVFTRFLDRAESFEVTFWRSLACAFTIALYYCWRERGVPLRVLRDTGRAGLVSGVLWATMFVCFMVAITRTTVANVLVMSALSPLFAALLAWVILGSRPTWVNAIAIAAALFGVWWMARDGLGGGGLFGMLIALGVPIASALNIIVLKRSGGRVDLVPAVWIGALLSAAVTFFLAYPLSASVRDVSILSFLGVFQLALPCMLMVGAARHLQPQEIALLALLEVVLGPLWPWLSLQLIGIGEAPDARTLVGGAVVIAALVFNELAGARAAPDVTVAPGLGSKT